jgi:hypothetical protein
VKHLIAWVFAFIKDKYSYLLTQYQALYSSIPKYQGLRIFMKGMVCFNSYLGIHFGKKTSLQAGEYKEILRFFYPLLCILFLDQHEDDLVKSALATTWSFIGFYYTITAKSSTDTSLQQSDEYLISFYKSREVFRPYQDSNFKFPKNHVLNHYSDSIKRKGRISTTDTQHSERAHKSAKEKYRRGNRKPGFERSIVDVDTAMCVMSSKRKLREKFLARVKGNKCGGLLSNGGYTLMGLVKRKWIDMPTIYQIAVNGADPQRCKQYNCIKIKWASNGIFLNIYAN